MMVIWILIQEGVNAVQHFFARECSAYVGLDWLPGTFVPMWACEIEATRTDVLSSQHGEDGDHFTTQVHDQAVIDDGYENEKRPISHNDR
jgi:hypothetical protein